MRTPVMIGIGVALLAGAAGAWWFLHAPTAAPSDTATASGSSAQTAPDSWVAGPLKPPRAAPAGYTEYRNEHYRFALFYPNELKVAEQDEGGGAMTIIFQNPADAKGFQIFVVPYAASQVTEAQFKKDEPSGVRQNPKDIAIDGATAVSFYSTNAALGETAEIWFIYPEPGRGVPSYLFEVTTLKPLAAWLSQIMATWQFL